MTNINSNKTFKHFLQAYYHQLRTKGEVVQPTSPYFGEIGSIPIEDISYENQVKGKLAVLKELFKEYLTTDQLEAYSISPSPITTGYRFKMDYVCSFNPFQELQNKFGQRQKKKFNWVVDMTSCILIPDDMFKKVREVYDFFRENNIQNYDLVKHIGNLRYLVVKQHKDNSMLIIISKEATNEDVFEKAAELALNLGFKSVYWVLNPSLGDLSEGEIFKKWGDKTIQVQVNNLTFKVGPNTFFQNNVFLFEELLNYVDKHIQSSGDELYDLYCGVGIIGVILASKFKNVFGIDINSENIQLAKESNEFNKISNIQFLEEDLNLLDITKLSDIKTGQTIVVDPPRTGLQKNGVEIIKKLLPEKLIYISCNPVTQAQDYKELMDLYEIKDIRGFDMFPHTLHVENLMVLEKVST